MIKKEGFLSFFLYLFFNKSKSRNEIGMLKTGLLIIIIFLSSNFEFDYYLPINSEDRKSVDSIELTAIGKFGLLRKERAGIPAHYHTGIDIKRPSNNYKGEPIFPIAEGIVISKREDGPYSQLIIEHETDIRFWTAYEHIVGITVDVNEHVKPNKPIARFMTKNELDRFGWQFDHFHFEVLKIKPTKLEPNNSNPNRHFVSYTLRCLTKKDLNRYFYNPIEFLEAQLKN